MSTEGEQPWHMYKLESHKESKKQTFLTKVVGKSREVGDNILTRLQANRTIVTGSIIHAQE